MTEGSAAQRASKQTADKDAVRPFQVNFPEAELTLHFNPLEVPPMLLLASLTLLMLSAVASLSAQTLVGDSIGPQSWRLRNNANPAPVIRGVATDVKWNNTGIIHDGDLNIFLKPNPEDNYVLINRANNENTQCADGTGKPGELELEIVTVSTNEITNRFSPGTNLVAKGLWVEDAGHCLLGDSLNHNDDKTELHPVMYLIGSKSADPLTAPQFSIFVGRDLSGRFIGDENIDIYNLNIDIPTEQGVVRPDLGEQGGTSDVGLLIENAVLDAAADNAPRSQQHATLLQHPSPAQVHFSTTLNPGTSEYGPFYLADFQRTKLQVFKDTVSYGIGSGRQNQNTVK